jgi:hypothetical protein
MDRQKCERDKKGKFIYTTGKGIYKRINKNGKNLMLHRHIWEQNFGIIPEGHIIHHINKNKLDNRIENLMLLDIKTHNKIHKHPAWNKGLKCENISKSKIGHKVTIEQINKSKETWKNKYIDSMSIIFKLKTEKVSWNNICKQLNLTTDQVKNRYYKYKKNYYE